MSLLYVFSNPALLFVLLFLTLIAYRRIYSTLIMSEELHMSIFLGGLFFALAVALHVLEGF